MKLPAETSGRLTKHKTLYLLGGLAFFFVSLAVTPLPKFTERQVTLPTEFWLRSQLGLDPKIDPRLKIVSYDDDTAARIKALDLPLGDWGLFFAGLARAKPKMIIVDKLFDKSYPQKQVDRFLDAVDSVEVPVYTIAFVSGEIPFRTPAQKESWSIPWKADGRHRGQKVYAADERILYRFAGVGHALYDGDGRVDLMTGLGSGQGIPHISLRPFVQDQSPLSPSNPVADLRDLGVDVPDDGSIIVNMPSPDAFTQYSLLGVLSRAVRGKPLEVIHEGDVVLVLPAMYTGNTDWRQTQHGSIPGGLINAAVLNSILSEQWVKEVGATPFWAFIGVLLGYLTLVARTLGRMLMMLTGLTLVILLVSLASFLFAALHIPWITAAGACLISGLIFYADRFRLDQLDKLRIAMELSVAIAVQESLAIADSNEDAFVTVQTYSRPSSECSGDWSGHFEPIPGYHYIAIADATGHGVGAALVSAIAFSAMTLQMNLVAQKGKPVAPLEILSNINNTLAKSPSRRASMTMCIALIESPTGTLTLSSGAHVFPVLIRPPGAEGKPLKALSVPGSVLGLHYNDSFREKQYSLEKGDAIVFFTDGLFECKNPENKDLGKKGGKKLLLEAAQAKTPPHIDEVTSRVNKFFGKDTVLDDDLTIVMATYLGDASTSKEGVTPS